MKTLKIIYISALCSAAAASAFAAKDISPRAFPSGGTVCYVGDSITHGGGYMRNITLFYATRYPEDFVNFYNLGISGDTVRHVNKRMKSDVLAVKPAVATLMIGMNNSNTYAKPDMDAARAKAVENNRLAYRKNLSEILDKFASANCGVILFTPSPYDETAKLETPPTVGKNGELREFSKCISEEAKRRGLKLVDMHGYMMKINAELQRDFPEKSVSGKDRVHPQAFGNFVMAANFVRTLGESDTVSRVAVDLSKKSVSENFNCEVSDLECGADSVKFTLSEHSLPFAVDGDSEFADKYVKFLDAYNRQIVKVAGLPAGGYELLIDGKRVGEYSAAALASGVDLGNNKNTPQHAQSLRVSAAADEFRKTFGTLREINATEMWQGLDDIASPEEQIAKVESLLKGNFKYKHPYIVKCAKEYKNTKPKQAEMLAKTREQLAKIYKEAQPKPHKYEIRRTAAK